MLMLLLHLAQFGAGDNGQVGQIELRITAAVSVAGGGDENRHFAVEKRCNEIVFSSSSSSSFPVDFRARNKSQNYLQSTVM